jgi:hypothetical protein
MLARRAILTCIPLFFACSTPSGPSDGSGSSGGTGAGSGASSASGGSANPSGGTSPGTSGTGATTSGGTASAGTSQGGTTAAGTSAGGASSSAGTTSAAGTSNGGGGGEVIGEWNQANLTNFESYPDPGSEECIEYNGCTWAGQFAGIDGTQTEQWVMEHNIAAVHSADFEQYKLKTLRLRMEGDEIDVVVYDECSDDDFEGCCTANSSETGFLIDVEKYTMQRFGHGDGIVEWVCLDCD